MTHPEIPEEVVEIAAKAAWDAGVSGEFPWATVQPESQEAWRREARAAVAAALPHLRVQETHGPLGVLGTDVGPFIRCSCGKNPTPKIWLEEHWSGEPEVGKRLVSQFFPAPRPVVDREALNRWIREEVDRAVAFHAATKGTGHQSGDQCDGWTALAEAMQLMHDDAPEFLEALALLPTEEDAKGEGS